MKARSIVRSGGTVVFLALLAWAAQGCSDKKNPSIPPGSLGADVTIDIVGRAGINSYSPNPDTVTVGQTVAWRNMDSTIHALVDDLGGITIGTGAINPGATSLPVTMTLDGTLPYHCTIHDSMPGTLIVNP